MRRLLLSLLIATIWVSFSYYVATAWLNDMRDALGIVLAYISFIGIVAIPGFAMVFVYSTLLVTKRGMNLQNAWMPKITILVAAYNEESTIIATLESIKKQKYDAPVYVIVCNDGSKDSTEDTTLNWIRDNPTPNKYFSITSLAKMVENLLLLIKV